MASDNKSRTWMKDLLVAFAATTLSIILTFGTSAIINRVNQKKERKLTVMMVLSNIESFCRSMEAISEDMARLDTVSTWLLALPEEKIRKMDKNELNNPIQEVLHLPMITYDRTAQNIFSNNLSTWENLGNFRFIDNVGQTFNQVNWIIDYWAERDSELTDIYNKISRHFEDYPGVYFGDKFLRNEEARTILSNIHSWRNFLDQSALVIRTNNRLNMQIIGITEQEVTDFTDNLTNAVDEDAISSSMVLPRHPRPNRDSLYTMPSMEAEGR